LKSSNFYVGNFLDFKTGLLRQYNEKRICKLSEMKEMYRDKEVVDDLLKLGKDRIIYEFYSVLASSKEGHLQYGLCIIYPGKIALEYHMTKGHFHIPKETAEIYIGLKGRGYLIMQTEDGYFSKIEMTPGVISYIPPSWAHRVINVGTEKLMFFAVCPSNIKHNYDFFKQKGFSKIVVEKNNKPTFIDNMRLK